MKKVLIIIIVLVVLGLLGFFYFKSSGYKTSTNNASNLPISSSSSATTTAPNSVSIENFSFNPGELTVKKGTEVTWTNNDSTTHTVTSDTNVFKSGDLTPGNTFKFTFNEVGTFNYHCSIHTSMTGKIIVE